jgi:hypothetical protein
MKFPTRDQKLDAVDRVDALRDAGETLAKASRSVGCSIQQYQRWKRGEGLGKRGVSQDKRTGRPPAVELTDDEFRQLHWHAIRKESTQLAIEAFLREGEARAEVVERLMQILDRAAESRKKPSWPLSVRRACKVTAEEAAMFRGKKAVANIDPVGFRSLTWIDEHGAEHSLRPGDLYESDDMSLNQPFRYGAEGEEMLGRQVLFSQDVTSLKFLGGSPLGRPKDAYRVEDIADHMLAIVEAWGLPLFWRLERGPWENDFVNGIKLDSLGARFEGQKWGALDDLFTILRAYGSRGKGAIEGSFNFFQALLQNENDTVEIGRERGEFEEAMKAFLKARSLRTPELRQKQLDKFWTIGEAANGIYDAMEDFGSRPKSRREWSEMQVPNELYMEHPGKRELRPEDRWYFYPEKKICTVRTGQIQTTSRHWGSKVFTVNGVPGAAVDYLPHGLKVLVAFDPARPELGAYVCNADTGSLNRGHWNFGEVLVPAAPDWSLEAPAQVDLRPAAQKRTDGQSKRNAQTAVRSEFRATRDAGKSGTTPASKSVARDGLGNSLALSNTPGVDLPGESPRRDRRGGRTARGEASPVPSRNDRPAPEEPAEADLAELEQLEAETNSQLY